MVLLKTMSIFNLNDKLNTQTLFGVPETQAVLASSDKYAGSTEAKNLQADFLLSNGNLFNNSVAYYSYKDTPFLVGVARCNNLNKRDVRTATSIHTRDAFSANSNWAGGWGQPDIPLFFLVNLITQETKFFLMNYMINELKSADEVSLLLEDPRICIHWSAKTVLFYATHNTVLTEDFQSKIGQNLSDQLNVGPKKTKPPHDPPQYLYVSWMELSRLDAMIDSHFFSGKASLKVVPNSTWKLLCSNLLNLFQEKNWVVLPETFTKEGEEPSYGFGFLRSIGLFTKGVVIYRMSLDTLKKPVVNAKGRVDLAATHCVYIQSVEGKVKVPGHPIQTAPDFKRENDKITVMADKVKAWTGTLLSLFFMSLPEGRTEYKSAKFTIEKWIEDGRIRVKYWYPFRGDNGQYLEYNNEGNHVETKKYSLLNGISSGGPACDVIDGNLREMLSVGHLKLKHGDVYALVVAALVYRASRGFQEFCKTKLDEVNGEVKGAFYMSAEEQKVWNAFVAYILNTENIFRYIYSFIHSQEPYAPKVRLDGHEGIAGAYRNLPILHYNLCYSSFLFKLKADDYQILTVSPQIFFDNSPRDCQGPTLQFSSTISSNGKDTYYIPYGHNDVQGRIVSIRKDDLHTFLGNEKILRSGIPDSDYTFYYDMAFQFFSVYTLRPGPGLAPVGSGAGQAPPPFASVGQGAGPAPPSSGSGSAGKGPIGAGAGIY